MNQEQIMVIGIGAAGGAIVDNLLETGYTRFNLLVADTDLQMLRDRRCRNQVIIGENTLPRPFCHLNPKWCIRAAGDSKVQFQQAAQDCKVVIIVAGLGGETGSVITPAICNQFEELGLQVHVVVTLPFTFEGTRRRHVADRTIAEIQAGGVSIKVVDANEFVPNDIPDIQLRDILETCATSIAGTVISTVAGILGHYPSLDSELPKDNGDMFYAPGRGETYDTSIAGLSLDVDTHSIDFDDAFERMAFSKQMHVFTRQIETHHWDTRDLLLGRSYGAWILINALMGMDRQYPGTVVLMCSALGFGAADGFRFISPRAWRFWEEAEARSVPPARKMALIHAADDNQCSIEYAQKLKELWGVELIEWDQGGHQLGKSAYQQEVSDSIRAVWGGD